MVSVGKKSFSVLHRSRWDIMASVLGAAKTGRTKTYIMRKCNLNYRQLQAYLDLLLNKELLKTELHKGKSNPEKIFVTTDKGRAFLEAYDDLSTTLQKGNLKLPPKFKTKRTA